MIQIEVPDMNDSMVDISIDREKFVLRFTYNEMNDFWSFGVYDNNREPIVAMTKIVPSFPLLHYYNDSRLPDGDFAVICEKENVGRYDFTNGDARFMYIPNSELE